mmetsp:Transcript_9734/g.14677  ORF Transcript_9734/g.14677 Transcript_9734/m.14677 type:complete len:249 (-) Transcript_9734:495-1241(-)
MPDAVSALRPWRTLVEELRLTGAKPISSSISKSKSPSESHDPLTIDPSPELHWSGSSSENGSDPSEKFCPPIGWRRSVIVSDASVVFLSSSLAAASNDCTGAPALPLPLLAESALDFFERLPRDFFILPRDLRSGFFFFCCMLSTTGSDTPGAHSINFSTHWVFFFACWKRNRQNYCTSSLALPFNINGFSWRVGCMFGNAVHCSHILKRDGCFKFVRCRRTCPTHTKCSRLLVLKFFQSENMFLPRS